MTTPFAEDVVPALTEIGFDAYKIASGDVTYLGLIGKVASTGRPVVISSGMSDLADIGAALRSRARSRRPRTRGPALRLRVSGAIRVRKPARYLDAGRRVPPACWSVRSRRRPRVGRRRRHARRMHLRTPSRAGRRHRRHRCRRLEHADAELAEIIRAMEQARRALGSGVKVCQAAEAVNVTASRRGLYARRAMRAGEQVSHDDVIVLRPGDPRVAPSRIARARWAQADTRCDGRRTRSILGIWTEAEGVSGMNILITAASRRVPLVQAFRQALASLGVPGRVVVTDVNPLSPAVQVADRAYRVPLAHDPEYLQSC